MNSRRGRDGDRWWAACAIGLGAWLAAHAACAQTQPWGIEGEGRTEPGAPVGEVIAAHYDHALAEAVDDWGAADLVRAGAFATWQETLAPGATAREHAALDLDGDGRVDRLLTVTPCRDPYPYDRSDGLVWVHATAAGQRATVLHRESGRLEVAWGRVVAGRRPRVTLTFRWANGCASDGFTAFTVRERFAVAPDGVLRWVDGRAEHHETN